MHIDPSIKTFSSKRLSGELTYIVHNDMSGDPKSVDDLRVDEFSGHLLCYLGDFHSFDPLCEVIYCDEYELCLTYRGQE